MRQSALTLRAEGDSVDCANCGENAVALLRCAECGIVVLDLMLPDMDGSEVIRPMRAAGIDTPVLILSGLARVQAKVKDLDKGG